MTQTYRNRTGFYIITVIIMQKLINRYVENVILNVVFKVCVGNIKNNISREGLFLQIQFFYLYNKLEFYINF